MAQVAVVACHRSVLSGQRRPEGCGEPMIKRPHLPIPRPSLKQVLFAGICGGAGTEGTVVDSQR